MKEKLKRLCIYPKDIQKITGKSERYSRDLIHKIRAFSEKQKHQCITIEDFCKYSGLSKEQVLPFIND